MSKWSHLPNAKYIDRIIAHVKANPKAWDAAWDAAFAGARGAARVAARGAISALVAWDRAGDLMDLPAEQVNILALLGDQTALLMYPAIRAIETTQELV
jgi:hypothetical protein